MGSSQCKKDVAAGERLPLVDKDGTRPADGEERGSFFDCGLSSFLSKLNSVFGYKFLVIIFLVQHLLRGFGFSLSRSADSYLLGARGVPAPEMQRLLVVSYLPLGMKPAIGLISDVLPVWGYKKAPYFLFASALGITSYFIIGTSSDDFLSVTGLVVCMFLCMVQVSTCDLLTDARVAEKLQSAPTYGPDLLTYVWFGISVAGLLSAMASGAVIQFLGANTCYLIGAVPAMLVVVPVVFGYFEEEQLNDEEVSSIRSRFAQQKGVCLLCVMMLVMTLTLSASGLFIRNSSIAAALGATLSLVMLASMSLVLSPTIAKFNAFSLLQTSFTFPTWGASFYFYTNTPEQYPEGPHFSPFFVTTVMGTIASVVSIFGIVSYNRYLKGYNYRWLLVFANIAFSLLSLLEVIVFSRLNVRLGIPDEVFALGGSVLLAVVQEWMWLPQVVINSCLCPEGMEATMFALLAGSHSLGTGISYNMGAFLLGSLGVRPSGQENESDQFDNLWIASLIGTVLPLFSVFLVFWLVPDANQNERLLKDEERYDPTAGSLWRRWTGDEGVPMKLSEEHPKK